MRFITTLFLILFCIPFSFGQSNNLQITDPEVYYGVSPVDSIDTSKTYIMIKMTVNLPDEIKEVNYKFQEKKTLSSNTIKEETTAFGDKNSKKVFKSTTGAREYELIGNEIIFHISVDKKDYIKVNLCKITVEDINGKKSHLSINL